MDKKDLTEQEIRTRYITPAIRDDARWPLNQIREDVYLTDGQIHPRGESAPRGKRKFADYVLYHHNQPLAIVEAKDNNHPVGAGMQQALEYAEMCDAPFAFSSNGDGFLEHDRLATAAPGDRVVIERGLPLSAFPSPDELWTHYTRRKALPSNVQAALSQPYHYERGGKTPCYYQEVATNAVRPDAGGSYYFGHSMIVNPIVWWLAQARGGEEIIAARLDPDPLRYVTWGSKSPQVLDHLENRNLALWDGVLKEARSRFELGKRITRARD